MCQETGQDPYKSGGWSGQGRLKGNAGNVVWRRLGTKREGNCMGQVNAESRWGQKNVSEQDAYPIQLRRGVEQGKTALHLTEGTGEGKGILSKQ